MYKEAKPISFAIPFFRVLLRKRSAVSKWETHKGKHSRVVNAGKYMVAFFPKRSRRCPNQSLALS